MKNKSVSKIKTLEEIKNSLNLHTVYDPAATLKQADMAINNPRKFEKCKDEDDEDDEEDEITKKWSAQEDPVFRAMTLSEFKNGALMVSSIPNQYSTFGIDMLGKLQEDYNCALISEKAIAELATINYIRTLEIQRRITAYLDMNSLTDNGVKFLAIMSKELDRANRHFLNAIQTLNMLKQPSLNVSIRTNTAIVGQNQIIQENQNVKPI